jgi:SAM-dependent methyltransferase
MDSSEELSPLEGYAAWAPCYDDDGNPLIALEGPAVEAWLGPVRGLRALDLGCGTGRHTLALAEGGAEVVALDQSPEMLARACQKLRGHPVGWVRHALPAPLPFHADVFDLAVLGLVAEHVADIPALLAEIARVLVPGGRCVLSALHHERTAEGQTARFIDPTTGRRRPVMTYHRTPAEYLAAAAAAGLADPLEQTLVVPPDLADRLPRAGRYIGQPLGWVARWVKPA